MVKTTTCGHMPYYAKNMCRNCYERNLRRRNPEFAEKQRENCRGWSEKNYERKRRVDNEYHKNMPYEQRRAHALMSRFGITLDEYDLMLSKQDGRCAICGTPQSELEYPLYIDHCHLTGRIRGLLCRPCNLGVGFWDKVFPITIDRARAYLDGVDGYGLQGQDTHYFIGSPIGYKKGSLGSNRSRHFRCCFGIDTKDYDLMSAKQNNCCAICGKLQSDGNCPMCVDHNHQTNIIRGLLCQRCNIGVAFLEKQPEFLTKMTAYLSGTCGFGIQNCIGKRNITVLHQWRSRKKYE